MTKKETVKMRCLKCDFEFGESGECCDTSLTCPVCGRKFVYNYNFKRRALMVRECMDDYSANSDN